MTNYKIKNSTDKPIALTLTTKEGAKEDHILAGKEEREIPKLAGAHVDFPVPVDITFRQKKSINGNFKLISQVSKDSKKAVMALDLPNIFIMLKIKAISAVK